MEDTDNPISGEELLTDNDGYQNSYNISAPIKGPFYSVFVPLDVRNRGSSTCDFVYWDKADALKTAKKTKRARFKQFEYYHNALTFAEVGAADCSKNESAQIGNEKMSPFKGPKPQDLVKLRKAIESGDVGLFRQAIWENPRYLVSSGDTPSILQEGFRYNALHIAAKAKSAVLTEIILSTIANPKYIQLLYGDDNSENVENRIQVLLDLYLNTPDKGLNETPLHFASKFGAANVVEVLVSFHQCDKLFKNKYGQTADMIICDRCENKNVDLKNSIASLLANHFYVPVLRAEDNSVAPTIGEPFSPGHAPIQQNNPLSPRFEIHAYAGPMNKEGAQRFRKMWKTPPRTSTPMRKKCDNSLDSVISLRYTDPSKGLERLGQKLASQKAIPWKEYWAFLDCFVDITNRDGLILLENYLGARTTTLDKSYPSSPVTPDDHSKRNMSSIADLCLQMEHCNINDISFELNKKFSAFLCIEKACNVFANRISSEIYHRQFDEFSQQVSLMETQVKQVELLVLSYMEDSRFNNVNFSCLHTRLGLLIALKMCYFCGKESRNSYISWLKKFLTNCCKFFDCYASDDESSKQKNTSSSTKAQLICIFKNIASYFNHDLEPQFELEKEMSCREAWLKTKECSCVFHLRRTRKSLGLSRSNSTKSYNYSKGLSRKLFVDESSPKIQEEISDDDEFFTPPSSPECLSDSDNEYSDPQLVSEIFIEASFPTKTDFAVFKALTFSDCSLSPERYPNLYRWFHNISLYPDSEKKRWPRLQQTENNNKETQYCATPPRKMSSKVSYQSPPSNSWLRITGASSPRHISHRTNDMIY